MKTELLNRTFLKEAKENGKLVFPGHISHLKDNRSFKAILSNLYDQQWVVYCRPPFSDAETVLEYLGRYTHRVAISNDRLLGIKEGKVTLRYRDREAGDRAKLITLDAFEFIRRFLLHVLPDGFMKIRHYGILSNRNRKTKLHLCKQLLGVKHLEEHQEEKEPWQELLTRITGFDPRICPRCGEGKMVLKEILHPSTAHPRRYHHGSQVPP